MSTSLTQHEIKILFSVIQKKGVKYVDVQHEIVDHLASDIELNKNRHPNLNFQGHIDLAFNKFPSDLRKIVRSKEKSMNRYWQRRTLTFMKSYFQLPTIITTIILYLLIVIGSLYFGRYVLVPVFILMLTTIVFTLIKSYNNSNYSKENEKKYLVLRMFFGQTITMIVLPTTLLNVLHIFKSESSDIFSQTWMIYVISAIATFTFMWCHACLTAFPIMLEEELKLKYPYLTLSI